MRSRPQIATILIGVGASGTERRMACVFEHLVRRRPGRHLLIVNRELYDLLALAGFDLQRPEVKVLEARSLFDRKKGAHASWLTNCGRLVTLLRYRREIAHLCRRHAVDAIQVFLEMVPVLGLWPIRGVTQIASLVSHLPKYYDGRSPSSRILKAALRNYSHIDALYDPIARGVAALGIPEHRISHPAWNCVDHVRFRPEPKEDIVTFTARAFSFKNPELMLQAVARVRDRTPGYRFYLLGRGPIMDRLQRQALQTGLDGCLEIAYLPDPSRIVNRSRIHVSLEQFDNATNQSLLEGMAAGCAIVASNVGLTDRVVTPDVGVLVPMHPDTVAEAVLDLIRRPDTVAAMGRAARAKVLRNHNIDRYLDYLTSIFEGRSPAAPLENS